MNPIYLHFLLDLPLLLPYLSEQFCFDYANKDLIYLCNSNPNIFPVLRPLLKIISSPQTNDDISAQLAELIGFDEIALVVDILENRSLVKEKVRKTRCVPICQVLMAFKARTLSKYIARYRH